MRFSRTQYVRRKNRFENIENMIDEEKSCNTSSDKTSFLLAQDRLSLYHLQKKHESLQQQQQQQQQKKEQKTKLFDGEALMSFAQMNQAEVISNSSRISVDSSIEIFKITSLPEFTTIVCTRGL